MKSHKSITGRIEINLPELQELVNLGVRRVCAFIRFGLDQIEERDGGDFSLSASLIYNFWPSEISSEVRSAAREEFRAWLIGSCLRELDQFYGLFLDRVWFFIEAMELHGTEVRSDHRFDGKFSKDTNVSKKQEKVASKLGLSTHLDELNSLSLARNSLAHNSGTVRSPVDCNTVDRSGLHMKWLGFDMMASRSGHEVLIEEVPFDTHTMPGEGQIMIGVKFSARSLLIPAGQSIRLSNAQIAEFCMFYKILSDKTIDAMKLELQKRGMLPTEG